MQKLLLILSVLLFSFTGTTQTVVVKGKVMDYQNDGVRSVKVVYGSRYQDFVASNSKGDYFFKLDISKLDTIQFIHVAYEVKTIIVGKRLMKRVKNDTLNLDILLNDMELGVIEVGVKKPDTLFGTQQFSIADYELTKNGNLLLLSYEKNLKKGSKLRLLDDEMKEIDSYIIFDECIELKSDFRNNIHLITTDNVYLVNIENGLFHI